MLPHGRNELSPFCRMPSQSNKLYKPVRETSDRAEQRMSPFRKEQFLHERIMAGGYQERDHSWLLCRTQL